MKMGHIKELFAIKEYEKNGEKKSFWYRVGDAYVNRDGSITIDSPMLPCRLQIRDKKEQQKDITDAFND